MPVIEIQGLTIGEKLQAMEELWEDLSRNAAQIPMPQWHKDLLDNREELIQQGEAKFVDWDLAKKRIASRIS
jgi:hypothetical protein